MILLADSEGPDQTAWMPEDTISHGVAHLISGAYMRGHFIWNLWNEPTARFIKFIKNTPRKHAYIILTPLNPTFI